MSSGLTTSYFVYIIYNASKSSVQVIWDMVRCDYLILHYFGSFFMWVQAEMCSLHIMPYVCIYMYIDTKTIGYKLAYLYTRDSVSCIITTIPSSLQFVLIFNFFNKDMLMSERFAGKAWALRWFWIVKGWKVLLS